MVRLVKTCFAILVLWLTPLSAAGDVPCARADLTTNPGFVLDLGSFACVLAEEADALSVESVLAGDADALFRPVEGDLIDFGFGPGRYWIIVRLRNLDDVPGRWILTHDIPSTDSLHVGVTGEDGEERVLLELTSRDTFLARKIRYRHLVSELALGPGEEADLLVTYVTGQATEMPLFVESFPAFFARSQTETLQIITLTALILGMGLISTVYLYGLEGPRALFYGAYVLTSAGLLLHMESLAFPFLWPTAPGLNQFALAVLACASIGFGLLFVDRFAHASRTTPRLHRITTAISAALFIVAALSAQLVDSGWFRPIGFPVLIAGLVMQVALALVAVRNRRPGGRMLLFGFGAVSGSLLFAILGYVTVGLFQQELAGDVIRISFLLEAVAFSAAIVLRIRAHRRERNRSLRAQVRLTEERLELSEALRLAEIDRSRAAEAARQSRDALASAAHDIRQPLASIQMALTGGEVARERIENSLTYLENIVRAGLEADAVPLGTGSEEPPTHGAAEIFDIGIVLKNVETMFLPEARRHGIDLRVVTCSVRVVADPLVLMRILGNLVSNALKHSDAGRVLVGCRRDADKLSIEVHDDGRGFEGEVRELSVRGARREGSDGSGLGLAIVEELVSKNDLAFELSTSSLRGTVAKVAVPRTTSVSLRTGPSLAMGERA